MARLYHSSAEPREIDKVEDWKPWRSEHGLTVEVLWPLAGGAAREKGLQASGNSRADET